jgi:hypothetical protein
MRTPERKAAAQDTHNTQASGEGRGTRTCGVHWAGRAGRLRARTTGRGTPGAGTRTPGDTDAHHGAGDGGARRERRDRSGGRDRPTERRSETHTTDRQKRHTHRRAHTPPSPQARGCRDRQDPLQCAPTKHTAAAQDTHNTQASGDRRGTRTCGGLRAGRAMRLRAGTTGRRARGAATQTPGEAGTHHGAGDGRAGRERRDEPGSRGRRARERERRRAETQHRRPQHPAAAGERTHTTHTLAGCAMHSACEGAASADKRPRTTEDTTRTPPNTHTQTRVPAARAGGVCNAQPRGCTRAHAARTETRRGSSPPRPARRAAPRTRAKRTTRAPEAQPSVVRGQRTRKAT